MTWIYSLLTALDPLLESQDVSILREVVRECQKRRLTCKTAFGGQLASFSDSILVIVAMRFGQVDLLSDFLHILNC